MKLLGLFFLVLNSSIMALALTNSTPADAPEYEAIVFINTDAQDHSTGDSSIGYCNGTLISPKLILTAAHCVSDAVSLRSNRIEIEVGHYIYVKRKVDGKIVRVGYGKYLTSNNTARFYFGNELTQKISNQGLQVGIDPEEDFAVIELNQAMSLPVNFQYAKMVSQSDFSRITNSQTNELTVTSINPFVNIRTTDSKRTAGLNSAQWDGGFFESKSFSRVEEGDSGAPLYVRNAMGLLVVGVVKGRGQNFFSNWDAYAPTAPLACEIARQFLDQTQSSLLCY